MSGFEELGKKLDKLTEEIKIATQSGIEKTAKEAKDWRKNLDELGEKIRRITQEGIEWFATETKEFGQIARLKSQIKQKEKEINDLFKQMGEKTYELHLQKKIGNVQLKSLGAKVTKLRKDIEIKKKQIQSLKKKE